MHRSLGLRWRLQGLLLRWLRLLLQRLRLLGLLLLVGLHLRQWRHGRSILLSSEGLELLLLWLLDTGIASVLRLDWLLLLAVSRLLRVLRLRLLAILGLTEASRVIHDDGSCARAGRAVGR